MAITAAATPTTLTWANFTSQAIVLDPIDGTPQDSVTAFNFALPNLPPRIVDGHFALADPMVITITPRAVVRTGATQTAALLAHEQLHYDVGFVIARVVAKEFMRLRGPTVASLAALPPAQQLVRVQADLVPKMLKITQLHFHTRAGMIQRRYDLDSGHSRNAHFQRVWAQNMAACLGNASATQLLGWWL